ncbi:TetR family transcriptional regulator [Frondihabitans sp. PhB188]|uniref:TetR/AcrR family transcriptional regulator n=1 Tax=Frondihabitans sp. PhB188 TaxID=2485200 RepID=UPI000F489F87|nr:TetR/AcrR family transcriptional regulator [Frondihabitans sp. PhB188]ROQ39565.1 TetR family transcriptional regulator [Frondihabitans sp. PhB188]
MVPEQLGLRDRKREETRRRLEAAAVELVLRDGLEHATVDSISARADVSSRTFFNYFDTKEDAVLGIHDAVLTRESVTEHIAATDGVDVLESTLVLLLSLIRPSIEGAALHESRVELLRRHPQLLSRHMVQMTRMVDDLVAAVTRILQHDRPGVTPSRAEAETLLSLCGGVVRTSVREWIDDGAPEPADVVRTRAIELVRSLIERIT